MSISQILGLDSPSRAQNPKIQQATGGRYYIRPYVDRLIDGKRMRVQERIYLQAANRREAVGAAAKVMAVINNTAQVLQAQMEFGLFLDAYLKDYVYSPGILGAGTVARYESQIKRHIRPAFGAMMMSQITTRLVDQWLAQKAVDGMSYAGRLSLRNLLCGIFTRARKWGYCSNNPALDATVGKARAMRPQVKMTTEQTRALLEALPKDVRLICEAGLYCTLRISEILGLQWKHVDFETGVIKVRQRYARGDVDVVKSRRSERNVPMGVLAGDLWEIYSERAAADPERDLSEDWVFSVRTHVGRRTVTGVSRDDRDIRQHFLIPAAKKLGIYRPGFGWHAFRREAVTALAQAAGSAQAQRMAGHATAAMTQHYVLADHTEQERAVLEVQSKFRPDAPVSQNEPNRGSHRKGATPSKLLKRNGGPDRTRICDLYRVNLISPFGNQ